jgi:N-acetylmuramoyl-L-alanine amidase
MGKTVTVQAGDTLLSIAQAEGIFDWQRIWNHPQNQSLRRARTNPQVLYQGDQVYVPDKKEFFKQVQVAVDQVHTFRTKKPACHFSVFLKNERGQPYAGNNYRLKLGDKTYQGTTGSDGLVSHPVSPTVRTGELTLWRAKNNPQDTYTWVLQVGHLNPIDTVSGVKQRLKNLGYHVGSIDENLDAVTTAAIANFQRHMGQSPANGELTEATRNSLVSLHNTF